MSGKKRQETKRRTERKIKETSPFFLKLQSPSEEAADEFHLCRDK
jgi:hypothetical protein